MILLADDEHRIGKPLENMLCAAGFGVRYVMTSEEALATIEQEGEGLTALITDIQLGNGVNGWDVARRARKCHPSLPILYISGSCFHEHRTRGVPASVMLQKPIVATQLLNALQTLFEQARTAATVSA